MAEIVFLHAGFQRVSIHLVVWYPFGEEGHMDFGLYWFLWVFAIFLPVELIAAKMRQKGNTFSETTWDWFGVKSPKPFGVWRRLALAAFLVSLSIHLLFATSAIPVMLTGAPVGGIILYSMLFERKR